MEAVADAVATAAAADAVAVVAAVAAPLLPPGVTSKQVPVEQRATVLPEASRISSSSSKKMKKQSDVETSWKRSLC